MEIEALVSERNKSIANRINRQIQRNTGNNQGETGLSGLGVNSQQSAITKNILNQILDHLKKGAKVHFSAEMKEYLKKYGIDDLQQRIDAGSQLTFFTTPQGEIYGFVAKDDEIY